MLAVVLAHDEAAGKELGDFYEKCLEFNELRGHNT
jgi:hypothetical protein